MRRHDCRRCGRAMSCVSRPTSPADFIRPAVPDDAEILTNEKTKDNAVNADRSHREMPDPRWTPNNHVVAMRDNMPMRLMPVVVLYVQVGVEQSA